MILSFGTSNSTTAFPELWLKGRIRGEKTRLAQCLSFCQVLLRPVHNKEMDWQVEKEDREASMIYCLQQRHCVPTPLAVSISKKAKYITPSAQRWFANTNDVICVLFGLIKALRTVMYPSKYVWACSARTHTHTALTKGLESIKACIAITFQCW